MLRLVNGLIPHFYTGKLEGNVLVGGQEMQQTPLSQTSRIVGSVFQNPRTQFFHLDTTGEMAFNLENQNVPRRRSSLWMSLLLIWIWRASENCRS